MRYTTFLACTCPSKNWYQSSINPCNCYSFIQQPTDWFSANNACQQQDSRSTLVSIDSAFENNEILGMDSLVKNIYTIILVMGQNQTSCSQFSIGLEQQAVNVWSWINNDTSTYRNWRAGKLFLNH
jgi:hypothetical protein